jgi:hypothetical protein
LSDPLPTRRPASHTNTRIGLQCLAGHIHGTRVSCVRRILTWRLALLGTMWVLQPLCHVQVDCIRRYLLLLGLRCWVFFSAAGWREPTHKNQGCRCEGTRTSTIASAPASMGAEARRLPPSTAWRSICGTHTERHGCLGPLPSRGFSRRRHGSDVVRAAPPRPTPQGTMRRHDQRYGQGLTPSRW